MPKHPKSSSVRSLVQIVSDGDPATTYIIGANGEEIPNVVGFVLRSKVDELLSVDLEIINASADITAVVDNVTIICPCCGRTYTHNCRASSEELNFDYDFPT